MNPAAPESPKSHSLSVGTCYKRINDGKLFRVLDMDPEEGSIWICRIACQTTRARHALFADLKFHWDAGRLVPVEIVEESVPAEEFRTPAQSLAFEKLRPGLQEILDLGYRRMAEKPLWQLIVEKATAVGVKPAAFNIALSKVLMAGGRIEAAMPRWDKSGRWQSTGAGKLLPTNQPGSYPLAVVDYQKIEDGVREFMRDQISWEKAHQKFVEKYYLSHERRIGKTVIPVPKGPGRQPSVDQFRYHGMRLVPFEERMRLLWGDQHVDTNMRPCPSGQSAAAIYPGFVWEIDWTWSDNVGVAKGSRLAIGRLTIYGVADPFDGYIYALYACLGNASTFEAGAALAQATEDKVALCARYGLEIEPNMWRGGVLPSRLRTDQGELDSWKSSGIATSLGIQLEVCPARRGDLKGTIESIFRRVSEKLRKMDGGTSGRRERLKEHPNLTAIFDLDQLQKLLFLEAIELNHRIRERQAMTPGMVAEKVKTSPVEIQEWAAKRGVYREADPVRVRLGTLPSIRVSLSEKGIHLDRLHYQLPDYRPGDPEGVNAKDWLMRARKKVMNVEVAKVPSTVDYILLRHRHPGEPLIELKCELADQHEGFRGFSWGMYDAANADRKEELKEFNEGFRRDIGAFVRATEQQIIAEAKAATAAAKEGLTKAAQINGVDERRADETESETGKPSQPIARIDEDEFFPDAAHSVDGSTLKSA